MTIRRKTLSLGVIAAVVVLTAGTLTAVALAANPKDAPVQYSAPFVCGFLPSVAPIEEEHLKPGDYATAINIHNPTSQAVSGSKRVALHYRMGDPVPPKLAFVNFSVAKSRVLEIDCVDIYAMAQVPPGSFLKGAIHIGLDIELPVAGIYTSQTNPLLEAGPSPDAGHSIDVEHIWPFQSGGPLE